METVFVKDRNGDFFSTRYEFEKHRVELFKNGSRSVKAKDDSFHMLFRREDGFTVKFGKTMEEDPSWCPFGPEIADIEITAACRGIRCPDGNRHLCPACYKKNTPEGSYMSLDTFKRVFKVIDANKTLTQIAFGVDAEASEELNPDIWKIFQYALDNSVVPNVTVADISKETAENIVKYCGAVSVSVYEHNPEVGYDTIKLLTGTAKAAGKKMAVNIHLLVSKETEKHCWDVLNHRLTDERLKDMNAVVFLSLKKKGRGVGFNPISFESYEKMINFCFEKNIAFGSDSCGCRKLEQVLKNNGKYENTKDVLETCESSAFSSYFNVKGEYFPCSFMEGEGEWKEGILIKDDTDFVTDVWTSERVNKWRKELFNRDACKGCPYYEV